MASPNRREVEEVVSVLGGTKVLGRGARAPEDLAERVREGLPFAALAAVMEQYAISRDVLCDILHLSRRNFLRRKEQKRLAPDESDRLYRLARVLAHANRVFEDPDEMTPEQLEEALHIMETRRNRVDAYLLQYKGLLEFQTRLTNVYDEYMGFVSDEDDPGDLED